MHGVLLLPPLKKQRELIQGPIVIRENDIILNIYCCTITELLETVFIVSSLKCVKVSKYRLQSVEDKIE